MTKEILLSIKGMQMDQPQEEGQELETITLGEYHKRNESHYVIYDEVREGFEDSTRCMIKFKDSLVEVTKKGLVNVHMIFEENKKNITSYDTFCGNILIGVDTQSVVISEEPDRIHISIYYIMEIDYQYLADCHIEIDICSREKGMEW